MDARRVVRVGLEFGLRTGSGESRGRFLEDRMVK
jgi:hypothetical protein